MLEKPLIALASGLLTLVVVLTLGSERMGLGLPSSSQGPTEPGPPRFAVEAHYVMVDPENPGGIRCNFGFGAQSFRWDAGPLGESEEATSADLAQQSLAWFLESPESDEWLSTEEPTLELSYPSADRDITVRHDPAIGLEWADQVNAWFERFPPTATAGDPAWVEGCFMWELHFGQLGTVQGQSPNAEDALEAMRLAVEDERFAEFFGAAEFDLGQMTRTAPRNMACYSVDTGTLAELDELPARLREKAVHVVAR